ncbi:hypothetical protein LWI28_009500 [Acer negundo]|uniref:Uncharacterized protein n=1 Tax=Acer negundo TaxID=4023 RepID=A0AAD5IYA4_ACENE|nr:hypothetical protein LWI28_009500 [Acer negundo]
MYLAPPKSTLRDPNTTCWSHREERRPRPRMEKEHVADISLSASSGSSSSSSFCLWFSPSQNRSSVSCAKTLGDPTAATIDYQNWLRKPGIELNMTCWRMTEKGVPMLKNFMHRMAAAKRRRILYPRSNENQDHSIANKGNFIVYTNNGKRFMVPLEYLSRNVFIEFLRMSEEDFNLPSHEA